MGRAPPPRPPGMFIQCKWVNLENCQLILNKLQCMFSKKKCQARFYKFLDLMPGVVQSYYN